MQILNDIKLNERNPKGPLRIPVQDKMKDQGFIIHGKVENGSVTMGDKLIVMPKAEPTQVLELRDAKGRIVEYATPGENVQIKLNITDDEVLQTQMIQPGYVICHRESPMPATEIFEAEVEVLELLEVKPIISKGYSCMMHIHTYASEISIKDIVKAWVKNDRQEVTLKEKPAFVRSQTKMICRIETRGPISLEKFDVMEQMGRFTLRDEGKTICTGKVLKYKPYVKKVAKEDEDN